MQKLFVITSYIILTVATIFLSRELSRLLHDKNVEKLPSDLRQFHDKWRRRIDWLYRATMPTIYFFWIIFYVFYFSDVVKFYFRFFGISNDLMLRLFLVFLFIGVFCFIRYSFKRLGIFTVRVYIKLKGGFS